MTYVKVSARNILPAICVYIPCPPESIQAANLPHPLGNYDAKKPGLAYASNRNTEVLGPGFVSVHAGCDELRAHPLLAREHLEAGVPGMRRQAAAIARAVVEPQHGLAGLRGDGEAGSCPWHVEGGEVRFAANEIVVEVNEAGGHTLDRAPEAR